MPCQQDAGSVAIPGQNDLARTKVRAVIILTSYFCAFDTIPDPVYGFTALSEPTGGHSPERNPGGFIVIFFPQLASEFGITF